MQLTVYSAPWCHTGKRAIPQFVIDGKWVQPYTPGFGFKYEEMAQLFGVQD